MRFTHRPASTTPADPHSQFAKRLDILTEGSAKTVAFDVTFSKPDQTGDAVRELRRDLDERKKTW